MTVSRSLPRASRTTWLAPLTIAAAGLLAYADSFRGVFMLDDFLSIVENPHLRRLWPLWDVWKTPMESTLAGRPVAQWTFALNYAAGKLDVWGYHAGNLLVHLCAALVLYGLLRRTFLTAPLRGRYGGVATGLAGVIALLWTVHPLQTQSVTYLVQRAEALMGLCYLLTLYAVVRGAADPS